MQIVKDNLSNAGDTFFIFFHIFLFIKIFEESLLQHRFWKVNWNPWNPFYRALMILKLHFTKVKKQYPVFAFSHFKVCIVFLLHQWSFGQHSGQLYCIFITVISLIAKHLFVTDKITLRVIVAPWPMWIIMSFYSHQYMIFLFSSLYVVTCSCQWVP